MDSLTDNPQNLRWKIIRAAIGWFALMILIVFALYLVAFENAWLTDVIATWMRVPGWFLWIVGMGVVGVAFLAWELYRAPLVDEHGRIIKRNV